MNLPKLEVDLKTGKEKFHSNGKMLPADLLSFWQWSSSNLVDNRMRGVLAEYIVAMDLDCRDKVRVEWEAYDLITGEGIKIEVKSAAYLQSWNQNKLSPIKFGIGKAHGWDSTKNDTSKIKERASDFYVFCLLAHKDKTTVDPLNLEQWIFYVLPTRILNEKVPDQRWIALNSLKKLKPKMARFGEIGKIINEWPEMG
ncbi:hypothetical protein [Nitrospina gracilis]|uniref:hypothetical protein n=1 Tax=Nitrospina gracilis TaxID=35801 RepID=UPI001F3251C5|nr:hypothetical protein [Nitrospina gracilis]MCF8719721.1 hypothetical protein [Nitrospina gracilis Nb-211]